jgi:hypothetical protein
MPTFLLNLEAEYPFFKERSTSGKSVVYHFIVIEPENSSPSLQQPTIGQYPELAPPNFHPVN